MCRLNTAASDWNLFPLYTHKQNARTHMFLFNAIKIVTVLSCCDCGILLPKKQHLDFNHKLTIIHATLFMHLISGPARSTSLPRRLVFANIEPQALWRIQTGCCKTSPWLAATWQHQTHAPLWLKVSKATQQESCGSGRVKSVAGRLAVGYGDQLLIGRWSHSPSSQFPSSQTPVVISEPFTDRTGPLRHMSNEMGSDRQWNVCLRRHPDNVTHRQTPLHPLFRLRLTFLCFSPNAPFTSHTAERLYTSVHRTPSAVAGIGEVRSLRQYTFLLPTWTSSSELVAVPRLCRRQNSAVGLSPVRELKCSAHLILI